MFYKWIEKSPIQSLTWAAALWWTSYVLILFLIFYFWTYELAVYQRLKGPVWIISAALLAGCHTSVISILHLHKKRPGLRRGGQKRHRAPAAGDESVRRSLRRKVDGYWFPPPLGCRQIFHTGASNPSPSTPNVDQSQVGESLPEIKRAKREKNPRLCCYMLQYLL